MSRSRATGCASAALALPAAAVVLVMLLIAYASLSGGWRERTELCDQADAVAEQLGQSAPPVTLHDIGQALDGAYEQGRLPYRGLVYRVGPLQNGEQELLVLCQVHAYSNWLISEGRERGCFRYLLHDGDTPAAKPVKEATCYDATSHGPLKWL